jgi:thymidylate synthase
VLQLFTPQPGLDPDAKDSPCTCNIQFLIRDARLHAIVYMRSNDAIWGLPYDVFLFTMLQELLSCQLGTELGSYFHFAGSLHLYRRHFELARRIISCQNVAPFEMPAMRSHDQLAAFLRLESQIRAGTQVEEKEEKTEALEPYWRGLLNVLKWYSLRKLNNAQGRMPPAPPESPYAPFFPEAASGRESAPRPSPAAGSALQAMRTLV